jgi:lipid II:glycine glycyltransferase (peptidoglycan interpeptide bridge formation enzyme)
MNSIEVLDISKSHKWSNLLKQLPLHLQDIYYTPEYYKVYENYGDGKAFCFVFHYGNNFALYPFLLNRINDLGYDLNDSYYHIEGAYGYNGVLSSSDDPDFIKNFYTDFNEYCKENNIIAEFTRFHPLYENHKFSRDFLDVIYDRKTVYVDLAQSYEEIYKNYSSSQKDGLKKARKKEITVSFFQNEFPYQKEFIQMYRENMERVKADQYLYFNDAYFDSAFNNLPIIQFVAFKEKIMIASFLCLLKNSYLHGYLLASREEYLKFKPNNLLYDEVIKFCYNNDVKKIHFGGGRSNSEDDSLLKFKKSFSKSTADFYIGKKIHKLEIYDEVIRQWEKKNSKHGEMGDNILLRYKNV